MIVNETLEEGLDLGVAIRIARSRDKKMAEDVLTAAAEVKTTLDRLTERSAILLPRRRGIIRNNGLESRRKSELNQFSETSV
jgi:hypothetical protein